MSENTKATKTNSDLDTRIKNFNDELIPLLGKYELGLGAVPFITNDGRIGARPSAFDDRTDEKEAKAENKPVAAE